MWNGGQQNFREVTQEHGDGERIPVQERKQEKSEDVGRLQDNIGYYC